METCKFQTPNPKVGDLNTSNAILQSHPNVGPLDSTDESRRVTRRQGSVQK
jgi:hypothetical protein